MKIFISHSSQDKWAARRISDDLCALGVEAFLDEKDIRTGESIDNALHAHLNDCDDFLILLSPASIRSQWVSIELGGAWTLSKKLVPILLYVGINDIPTVIGTRLARNINDIHLYYEELRTRLGQPGLAPARSAQSPALPMNRAVFQIGETVRLPASRQPKVYMVTQIANWTKDMSRFCGKLGKITEIQKNQLARLDIDGGRWWWAVDWLERVGRQ